MNIIFLLFQILIFSSSSFSQCPKGFRPSSKNLIINGDFSNGNVGFTSDYLFRDGPFVRPGMYGITEHPENSNISFAGKGNGNIMAVDGAQDKNKIVWKQTISVKPQTIYLMNISIANLDYRFRGMAKPLLTINTSLYSLKSPRNAFRWNKISGIYKSGNNNSAILTIVDELETFYGNDFALDDISLCECILISNWNKQVKDSLTLTATSEKSKKNTSINNGIDTSAFFKEINTAKEGQKINLKHVYFERSTSNLKENSFSELDKIVAFMKLQKNVKIRLEGHTDNQGDSLENILLSKERVAVVKKYLVQNGIEKQRISAMGYGGAKPTAKNDHEDSRHLNRRVEIVILKR